MDEGSLSLPPFTGYDEKSQRNYHLALRGNSLNPMIDAATPLLGMVMRLSTMNSQTMPEHLFGHCCKVSDEAAFCLIQRPYISKTLLTRRISPRGSP